MCLSLEALASIIRTGKSVLVELCYNKVKWSYSDGYDYDSHSPAFLDLFISSDAIICSTMTFPPLRNSDVVVASASIDFSSNSK